MGFKLGDGFSLPVIKLRFRAWLRETNLVFIKLCVAFGVFIAYVPGLVL